MTTTTSTATSDQLAAVDAVLADRNLLGPPRALLLLRICQAAQVFRPDVVERYWQRLKKASGMLPQEHREAYKGLRASIEASEKSTMGAFARGIVDEADAALKMAGSDPSQARKKLQEAQARLGEQWWWPFGKGPAWIALVLAWSQVDRKEALKLVGKLPREARRNILERLNDQSPLTPEEWDIAKAHGGGPQGIMPVLKQILDKDKPVLHLPEDLAKALADSLRPGVHAMPGPNEEESSKLDARRDQALARYLRLLSCIVEDMPDTAESLMEKLFEASVFTARFNERWPNRFTYLRQLINFWVCFPALREKALAYLVKDAPKHLVDFLLAHWYGMIPNDEEEAKSALASLREKCKDKAGCEAWFLVTLVRRDLGEIAMKMARSSPNAGDLFPRLRRAWLCEHPETASKGISSNDLEGDFIGQFLLLGSAGERVEWLRKVKWDHSGSLPAQMWRRLTVSDITSSRSDRGDPDVYALVRLYSKDESQSNQFKVYLRLHGYGQYGYEDIDPYLLAALIALGEEYPEELRELMSQMWSKMRPTDSELGIDVLRNSVFERCRTVLAANPGSLSGLFISWVKRTLVDNVVRRYEGQMIYTLSLKSIVPFLFCLLSAQSAAKFSFKHCDEILKIAIGGYEADEDLVSAAGGLYASDKGLSAMKPPASLKNPQHLQAWQLGVVGASIGDIIKALLAGEEGKEKAGESSAQTAGK